MGYCCNQKLRLLITIVVISALVFLMPFSVDAKENGSSTKKQVRTHDIAIVYDTSGSMYEDGNDAWSQALYAVEVFASMLDYKRGDKLGIYPMGDVSITQENQANASKDRIDITSEKDIQKIEQIYVPITSWTVFEPVYTAEEYLKKSTADEKWLIVLTDGQFNQEYNKEKTHSERSIEWVTEHLAGVAERSNGDIHVQYLGFANASVIPGDESKNFYSAKAVDAADLTNQLVEICNKIFQRDMVPGIEGGTFSVDVSMNSIVAFVQGEDSQINSLQNAKGKEVKQVMDINLQPNTLGTGEEVYKASQRVADVSGQVMTFEACSAGEYTLDYKGSNVQVFYEPNVILDVALKDENGERISMTDEITTGDYTLEYGLIDGVTGENVDESALLSPVNLSKATVNNGGITQTVASGGTVHLEPDAETFVDIEGSFLNKYTISTKDNLDLFTLNVVPPVERELIATLSTEQKANRFRPRNIEDWKPIRLDVKYDGRPLTNEELEQLQVSLEPSSSEAFPYIYEKVPDESAIILKLGRNKNGEYVEPERATTKLKADCSLQDEYGREIHGQSSMLVDTHTILNDLKWLIIIAAAIAAFLFIMTRKAWPSKIEFEITSPRDQAGKVRVVARKSMTIVPYRNASSLGCTAEKNSTVWNRITHNNVSIKISDLSPERRIESVTIGTAQYTRANGFKDGKGKEFEGIITNGKTIILTLNGSLPVRGIVRMR